jgi:hypothetical protein
LPARTAKRSTTPFTSKPVCGEQQRLERGWIVPLASSMVASSRPSAAMAPRRLSVAEATVNRSAGLDGPMAKTARQCVPATPEARRGGRIGREIGRQLAGAISLSPSIPVVESTVPGAAARASTSIVLLPMPGVALDDKDCARPDHALSRHDLIRASSPPANEHADHARPGSGGGETHRQGRFGPAGHCS